MWGKELDDYRPLLDVQNERTVFFILLQMGSNFYGNSTSSTSRRVYLLPMTEHP